MKEPLKNNRDKITVPLVERLKHALFYKTLQAARNRKRLFQKTFENSVSNFGLKKTSDL